MTTALLTESMATVGLGAACRVVAVDSDVTQCRRLAELGIRPGSTFTVTQRISGGGLIIKKLSTRYAIDKRTAAHIEVEVL